MDWRTFHELEERVAKPLRRELEDCMALQPEVLKELEAESVAREHKAAELPVNNRVNALEARLARCEAALASNTSYVAWSDLPKLLLGAFKEPLQKLRDENKALAKRIDDLEKRAPVKYMGVYRQGATYSQGSLVTRDCSIFHANKTTSELPGDGCQDWTLAVKRGGDASAAK